MGWAPGHAPLPGPGQAWSGSSGRGRHERAGGGDTWKKWLPLAAKAGGPVLVIGGLIMIVLMAAVMALPSYLRHRQEVQQAAATSVTPLSAPESVEGLTRDHSEQARGVGDKMTAALRDRGYDNTAVAVYGNGGEGLLISLVRTPEATDRARFVRFELGDQQARYDGLRLTEVARGKLVLDCAALPASPDPLRSFCLWNDGDTAGLALGYQVGVDRLATLAASGRTAMTSSKRVP